MNVNNNVWKNIEKLGEKYCQDNLADYSNEKLEHNWWESLKFFFIHSFMRGRRDELSLEYYYFTIDVLKEAFKVDTNELDQSYNNLKSKNIYFDNKHFLKFKSINKNLPATEYKEKLKKEVLDTNPIIELLKTEKKIEIKLNDDSIISKKIHLGNDEDIMMVLDVLKFISSNDQRKNIYAYIRNIISPFHISEVYTELISELRGVGDKIASFIIRDIILINGEIDGFTESDMKRGFPIDTWVNQIAKKLNCFSENLDETKNNFIRKCLDLNINSFKMAAGLWYLGYNSLDILLENCFNNISNINM